MNQQAIEDHLLRKRERKIITMFKQRYPFQYIAVMVGLSKGRISQIVSKWKEANSVFQFNAKDSPNAWEMLQSYGLCFFCDQPEPGLNIYCLDEDKHNDDPANLRLLCRRCKSKLGDIYDRWYPRSMKKEGDKE